MPSNGPNIGAMHGVFGLSSRLIQAGIDSRSCAIFFSSTTSLGSCGMPHPPFCECNERNSLQHRSGALPEASNYRDRLLTSMAHVCRDETINYFGVHEAITAASRAMLPRVCRLGV